MCRSAVFKPIGRYVNADGSEEIRPVDSTVIDSIEWLITNREDNSSSQRAYVETSQQRTLLQALASGDIFMRARALSLHTGIVETSAAFERAIQALVLLQFLYRRPLRKILGIHQQLVFPQVNFL